MNAPPGARLARAAAALAAAALVATPALASPASSSGGRVAVVVVPRLDPAAYARRGTVGLLVPGAGSTVTRAGALSSLVRGKVVTSLLGGRATGRPLVRLARAPAETTVYVTLPPPGRTHNVRRYPFAIVGPGYGPRRVAVSGTTRIPGLVSIADLAPTAVALAAGRTPVVRSHASADPARELTRLDTRLRASHDARTGATIVLVAWPLVLSGLALLLGSALLARAGLLAIPAALAVAVGLAAAGATDTTTVTVLLAVLTGSVALVAAVSRRAFVPVAAAILAVGVAVLAVRPATNALAVIGPHPDGGGRFYGVTNQVETLLLAPILGAGALFPSAALVPFGALAVLLVGWSRAGADGGGIVVVVVALVALWAFRERIHVTPLRAAAAAAGIVAVALALVGLDALTGGASHVTHAVGAGPGSLLGDLGHRLHVSWEGVTATAQAGAAAAATLLVLVVAAFLRPRVATVDALLVALAASLLVNDTPTDVLAYGALVATALRVLADVSRRSRESASPSALRTPRVRSRRSSAAPFQPARR